MGSTLGKNWLICQVCAKPFYPLIPRQSMCLSCIVQTPAELQTDGYTETLHTLAVRRHRLYTQLFRMDTLIQLKRDSLQLHYMEANTVLQQLTTKELDGHVLSPAELKQQLRMRKVLEDIAATHRELDALGMVHINALKKAHSARSILLEQLEEDIYDTIVPADIDPLDDLYKSCE